MDYVVASFVVMFVKVLVLLPWSRGVMAALTKTYASMPIAYRQETSCLVLILSIWKKEASPCSACPGALQAFQQSFFARRVAADNSLKGLIALNVVGQSLEE